MERSYRRQPRGASSTDAHRESTDDGDHASAPLAPLATAKPPALATAGPGWSAAAAYPAPLPPTLLSVRTTPCLPRLSCPTPPHPGPRPPPPPSHIFKDKKNQSRGSSVPRTALRTSLRDGIGGLFACTCFPRSMPARTAIPGNRWATRCPPRWPGGEPDTPADTTAGWCPSPLTSPHVALAALAPKATGRLASRPARAIYRPRPRRHPLPAAI